MKGKSLKSGKKATKVKSPQVKGRMARSNTAPPLARPLREQGFYTAGGIFTTLSMR
tara:strand:+ start:221 stop:388 length:168 start_codon:yes stop_codon:yes gene_type:complete